MVPSHAPASNPRLVCPLLARALLVEAAVAARGGQVSPPVSRLVGFAPPGSASATVESDVDAAPAFSLAEEPEPHALRPVISSSLSSAAAVVVSSSAAASSTSSSSITSLLVSNKPPSSISSLPSAPVVVEVAAPKEKKARVQVLVNPCGVPNCSHPAGSLDQLLAHLGGDAHPLVPFVRAKTNPPFLHVHGKDPAATARNLLIIDAITLHKAWNPPKGETLAVSFNLFQHLAANVDTCDFVPASLSEYGAKRASLVRNVVKFYTTNGLRTENKSLTELERRVKNVVEEKGLLKDAEDVDGEASVVPIPSFVSAGKGDGAVVASAAAVQIQFVPRAEEIDFLSFPPHGRLPHCERQGTH